MSGIRKGGLIKLIRLLSVLNNFIETTIVRDVTDWAKQLRGVIAKMVIFFLVFFSFYYFCSLFACRNDTPPSSLLIFSP